jgi:hypothetical protein
LAKPVRAREMTQSLATGRQVENFLSITIKIPLWSVASSAENAADFSNVCRSYHCSIVWVTYHKNAEWTRSNRSCSCAVSVASEVRSRCSARPCLSCASLQ